MLSTAFIVATTTPTALKVQTRTRYWRQVSLFNTMGKGDRKTKRGKIFIGSFGNCRPKKIGNGIWPPKPHPPKPDTNRKTSSPVTNQEVEQNTDTSHSESLPIDSRPVVEHIEWFQPKAYTHLGKKLTLSDGIWVEQKVKDVKWVSEYCFYPLLHRAVSHRRFKRCTNGKKAHFDAIKYESTKKTRHIFYANHLDSAIYSYYAKVILGGKYEQVLSVKPELSECISAYRTIKVNEQSTKGKSNIHFAKDVFDYIKTQTECVALAFDITGFFDNINHLNLKKAWLNLLNIDDGKLPPDHFNVYQSLTKFAYIEEISLLKLHGLQAITNRKKRNRKLENLGCFCKGRTGKQKVQFFRNSIAPKFIVPHSEYERIVKGKDKGIPQGTPISALLANVYLLEFDEKMLEKVTSIGGLYRRYSDDITVVCPSPYRHELEKFVSDLISVFSLEINNTKTETSCFAYDTASGVLKSDRPFRYLGFEFDGNRVFLKCSALSKYHRRKKHFVKRKNEITKQMMRYKDVNSKLWEDEIWRKHSSRGRKNFLSYTQRAATIMGGNTILRQVRKHKRKLGDYVIKHRKSNGL